METGFNFDDMRPYYDSEIPDAIARVCNNEEFLKVLPHIFPEADPKAIVEKVMQIKSADDFQQIVMTRFLGNLVENTSDGMTNNGMEALTNDKKYLFISNHRDIILDAALLNVQLIAKGIQTSQNAIGDNLCSKPWITDLMKINKSLIVNRSGTKREIFMSSQKMSAYIRSMITENKSSVWIAQREGRAKDSNDVMQESLLKMLNMSSENVKQGFMELNITPIAICYEYDACDFLKAKEFQQKRDNPEFKKSAQDDIINMNTGLRGYKGRIHYEVTKTISPLIDQLVNEDDDRQQVIEKVAKLIDGAIHKAYRFFPGNYVAYDERFGTDRFKDKYSTIEKNVFDNYLDEQINKIDIENKDEEFLRMKMLEMYSNTLVNNLASAGEL
ncbi:MAG: 1-acyl-sn-glycerol-3-phosphate acyltransferase [Paludibacteraceae bacterium]|nr:1-acyl-sn-glycerol-3-phosphate acyltransferase [Paludibacteraceae bacterium]